MQSLITREWRSIYESHPAEEGSYLVDDFYIPALKRSIQYDRVAGYFSSSALAVASNGINALLENDGKMRLIVGTELYSTDRPVLEALTDELSDELDELDDERLDAQLKLLARLLREGRLHIKVAVARSGSWRIFHPKMGIFRDDDGHKISFEGSVNETVGGWKNNYERFKLHRSWVNQQETYVEGDTNTFGQLWSDEHPHVEVHDLPEAIEKELIDWKDPNTQTEFEQVLQLARGEAPPTEQDKANIIADGAFSPGGLALAEEGSTITPWPHQRVVSDTLVNTYPNSFLLCDEVGLGKTIEAGLTLSRLGLSGELETGLLLVPASLTVQWQEELWEKFNINAYRFDRGSNYDYVFHDAFDYEHTPPAATDLDLDDSERGEAWVQSPIWRFIQSRQTNDDASGPTIVIMSWHTARLDDRWDEVAPEDNGEIRTRDNVPASCRGRDVQDREGVWDAVVVDEAHNARAGSKFYSLLERLREHTQTYYLLTATPMQLHSSELYDLMTLLNLPEKWDKQDQFVKFFQTRQALSQALEQELAQDGSETDSNKSWSAQATLDDQQYQDRLSPDRTLSNRIFNAVAASLDITDDEQARSIAKQRVLEACTLAAGYGEQYDGYIDRFDSALGEHDVDPFEAKEDEKLKYLLYPEWKAEEEWLTYSRNDRLRALDDLSESGWRVVRDVLAESTPVDALIHRNTRDTLRKYEQVGLLDTTVPSRDPEQRQIKLTNETRAVYDRIDDYTRKFYKLAQQSSEAGTRAIGFVMTTYRQRLTSSVYAISQSLQNRLETLQQQRTILEEKQRVAERKYNESKQFILENLSEYDLEEFDAIDEVDGDLENTDLAEVVPNVTDEGVELLEKEIEALESFVSDLARVESDPKIGQLIEDLDEFDREGHNRVIIFTQYTDTMDFIRDRLVSIHGSTVATYSGRGGELYNRNDESWTTVGKERVKREFANDNKKVDILVCTDSASEGLNLQECGALINYDLPWNPMRVEQRIGRVDRIGQRYDEVTILNYSYKDTVETDIYDRLDDRIGLFESVVGDMQPILSGVSQRIRDAALKAERDKNHQVVEETDREISAEIDDQNQHPQVDVDESLEAVDTLTEKEVIDEAKLNAWQSHTHPDLNNADDIEYEYPAPFRSTDLQTVLTHSETLAELGVEFSTIRELEIDFDNSGFNDATEFRASLFRLSVKNTSITITETNEEQTLAQVIAPADQETAVTFSTACANEFQSIEYLAPGHPLLDRLIRAIQDASDTSGQFRREVAFRSAATPQPVTCGWGRDGSLARLIGDGDISEESNRDIIDTWSNKFTSVRDELADGHNE